MHNDAEFLKWKYDASTFLRHAFGEGSSELRAFGAIRPSHGELFNAKNLRQPMTEHRQKLQVFLAARRDEIVEYGYPGKTGVPEEAISSQASLERVEAILNRFHVVACQLVSRQQNRDPLLMEDEYDVQYLLGALLKLDFDDVRPEEYTPSYAGGASRMDFLLKTEQIVVETKMTRTGLADRKVGEELTIDIASYQSHQDCKTLVCFVYDPSHMVRNAAGLVKDLGKSSDEFSVEVIVRPTL